jgi:hypothetical protein
VKITKVEETAITQKPAQLRPRKAKIKNNSPITPATPRETDNTKRKKLLKSDT